MTNGTCSRHIWESARPGGSREAPLWTLPAWDFFVLAKNIFPPNKTIMKVPGSLSARLCCYSEQSQEEHSSLQNWHFTFNWQNIEKDIEENFEKKILRKYILRRRKRSSSHRMVEHQQIILYPLRLPGPPSPLESPLGKPSPANCVIF